MASNNNYLLLPVILGDQKPMGLSWMVLLFLVVWAGDRQLYSPEVWRGWKVQGIWLTRLVAQCSW